MRGFACICVDSYATCFPCSVEVEALVRVCPLPLFVCCPDMVRAGLLALQFYTPATSAWGQAHMHARHAILRVSGGVPVW